MNDALTWIVAHQAELLAAAGAGYVLLSIIVRLTPTQRDDEALSAARAFVERLSFLQPRDGIGVLSLPGVPARRDPLESRK